MGKVFEERPTQRICGLTSTNPHPRPLAIPYETDPRRAYYPSDSFAIVANLFS
jgi:hypothetical protein